MPGELRLTLLGHPSAQKAGAPLENFVYNKGFALLCYLATTGRPHSREALAGLLWGDMTGDRARANLRKILRYLRQVVPEHLVITRQTVAFDRDAPHWLDVRVFESRLQGIKQALDPVNLYESEERALSEAVALYNGDFMDGFYVHDAPDFEEWVMMQRERMRQLALHTLHSLARYYTEKGSFTAGIACTTRLLALEPWHEEFHQQMMLLLALSGQRSAAIRQYEACRNILRQELDVEASADTITLFRQIQSGKIGTAPPPTTPLHNLTASVTPFVGFADELRLINERLCHPACRLVTLVGIGGAGKTRLAQQAASQSLSAFPDGVYVVRLPAVGSSGRLVAGILEALALPGETPPDRRAYLLDHLRGRQMLLLLDDLDQTLDSMEVVVEILEKAPKVKILATALDRLDIPGEWVLLVHGLRYPPETLPPDVESYDAVHLFVAHARRIEAGFVLHEEDFPSVARICRLVHGLPLAVELAATWAHVVPIGEIAHEIENDLDFLTSTSMTAPEGQRSVRAIFDRSWQQLSDNEKDAFKRLSVFRGGFCREAAEQVADACLPALAGLLDRGLLQVTTSARYEIHELLRRYGAEKLAESPEQAAETAAQHYAYYSQFLRQREMDLRGPRRSHALDEIAAEVHNIREAWKWAFHPSKDQHAGQEARAGVHEERIAEGSYAFDTDLNQVLQSLQFGEAGA